MNKEILTKEEKKEFLASFNEKLNKHIKSKEQLLYGSSPLNSILFECIEALLSKKMGEQTKIFTKDVCFDENMEWAWVRNSSSETEAAMKLLMYYQFEEEGRWKLDEIIPLDSVKKYENCYVSEDEDGYVNFKIWKEDGDIDRFFDKHELEHLETIY